MRRLFFSRWLLLTLLLALLRRAGRLFGARFLRVTLRRESFFLRTFLRLRDLRDDFLRRFGRVFLRLGLREAFFLRALRRVVVRLRVERRRRTFFLFRILLCDFLVLGFLRRDFLDRVLRLFVDLRLAAGRIFFLREDRRLAFLRRAGRLRDDFRVFLRCVFLRRVLLRLLERLRCRDFLERVLRLFVDLRLAEGRMFFLREALRLDFLRVRFVGRRLALRGFLFGDFFRVILPVLR